MRFARTSFLVIVLVLTLLPAVSYASSSNLLVSFRVKDRDGKRVTWLRVGDEFTFNVYVEDMRERPYGVAAAYLDVRYDEVRASVTGPLVHGDEYNNVARGFVDTPGLIDEAGGGGGFARPDPPGAEYLLFSVPMRAEAPGMLSFTPEPADGVGKIFMLRFGGGDAIPFDDIHFIPVSVPIASSTDSASKEIGMYFRYSDVDRNPIHSVVVGEDFYVELYLQDLRDWPYGVAGGFFDLLWEQALASAYLVDYRDYISSEAEFGPEYGSIRRPGVFEQEGPTYDKLDGIGSWGDSTPPQPPHVEHLQLRIRMKALSPGDFRVIPRAGDGVGQDVVVWHSGGRATPWDEILLVIPTLTITDGSQTSPWTNPQNRYDVNDDGNVNPLDGLFVLTDLETNGYRELPNPPTAEESPPPYYDVSGDGFVSPLDVLWIFDFLAQQ